METKNVVVDVVPTKQQLLTTKGRVSCTEDGCTKSFPHSGALRMHTVKSHGLIKDDRDKCLFHKRKSADKTVFQFHCPVNLCQYGEGSKKYFSAYCLVKQHYLKVHAERRFPCSRCDSAFISERDLKQHQERCGILYRCGTCTVSYTTKEALHTHCKRQNHSYPEEYLRQIKQKLEKKQNVNKKPSPTQPVVTIITQPMILVPVPTKEPVRQVRNIQPKPVSQKLVCSKTTPEVTTGEVKASVGQGHVLTNIRQDALIQTDIYGVDTLNLDKNSGQGNKTMYSKNPLPENTKYVSQISTDSQSLDQINEINLLSGKNKTPPKKQTLVKRRFSHQKDLNPSSPRRKKMKSTTGIQTSVSFTKKRGVPTVNSTQTTGDYIIETALRHANIQIEKKTVASQVTPQKPGKMDVVHGRLGIHKPKPILVDSFSQVKQQNIQAETSHNLAESQTMTDLPPSISTQTLQSYLVNLQERHSKVPASLSLHTCNASNKLQKSPINNNNNSVLIGKGASSATQPMNGLEVKSNDHVVQIYSENLNTSVNYIMPEKARQSQSQGSITKEENLLDTDSGSPQYTAVPLEGVRIGTATSAERFQDHTDADQGTNSSANVNDNIATDTLEENYLTGHGHITDIEHGHMTDIEHGHMTDIDHGHTADMGAQTMSASEFDTLLQSSGIFTNNSDFLFGANHNQSLSTSTQDTGTDPSELASELDFLSTNTDTIDMNTQTVDFSFLESFEPIDSNTQTVGDGLDFLDMVMTNMETQTLNDDDLVHLGLLDSSLASGSMQTFTRGNMSDNGTSGSTGSCVGISVGTDDSRSNSEHKRFSTDVTVNNETGSQISSVTTSTSSCFLEAELINKNSNKSDSEIKNQISGDTERSEYNPLVDSDEKVRVQTETQTVTLDIIEPLLQTETQTQVESTDTDFATINMETQTTFEDLQQLCDWLQ